jgi:DNA invertase Pin-like site-specific DNA recombinase
MSVSQKKPLRAVIWCAVSTPEQAADEKESLPAQKRDLLTICEDNGWRVTDVIEVPGFSRRYLDLDEFAYESSQQGITAGYQLKEHLLRGDFDVFVVRDGDRFGRSQSLFARVAEDILFVQRKAIYAQFGGGLIDEANGGREWITMQSYRASKEVDDLVRKRDMGMRKRAERGIRLNTIAFPYRVTRDANGKELGVEPDRSVQHIIDDAVQLLLEGHPWDGFERELYKRYGHGRDNRPYSELFMNNMFYRPIFHGHSAWRILSKTRHNRANVGCWMFDLTEPPPEGVYLFPNTHEPYYSGETMDAIQAELKRRREIRGRMSPRSTSRFSGLLICGDCEYMLVYYSNRRSFWAYHCKTHYHDRTTQLNVNCTNTQYISMRKIREWLTPKLQMVIEDKSLASLFIRTEGNDDSRLIDALRMEIAELENEARELIRKRVPEPLRTLHEDELSKVAETLSIKQARLAEIERRVKQKAGVTSTQQHALMTLSKYNIDEFWNLPDREVNQILRGIFGDYRMVVMDGAIQGIAPAPPRLKHRRLDY